MVSYRGQSYEEIIVAHFSFIDSNVRVVEPLLIRKVDNCLSIDGVVNVHFADDFIDKLIPIANNLVSGNLANDFLSLIIC